MAACAFINRAFSASNRSKQIGFLIMLHFPVYARQGSSSTTAMIFLGTKRQNPSSPSPSAARRPTYHAEPPRRGRKAADPRAKAPNTRLSSRRSAGNSRSPRVYGGAYRNLGRLVNFPIHRGAWSYFEWDPPSGSKDEHAGVVLPHHHSRSIWSC